MLMPEFRELTVFPGYRVSNYGVAESCRRPGPGVRRLSESWHQLTWVIDKATGYARVTLRRDGKSIHVAIHTLVLNAFVGPCPSGMECLHDDGNKLNNRLDNLSWGTRKANQEDRIRHGTSNRGTKQGRAILNDAQVLEIVRLWKTDLSWTMPRLAEEFHTKKSTIQQILNGYNWAWLTGIKHPRELARYKSIKDIA
jgi:hypothetical protein